MIIKEEVIVNLRKGKKEALQEIYNVYHPLYIFYLKYLLRNDQWVQELVMSFYRVLYNDIDKLEDNYNFEFYSLMLIKKMVRTFFKESERFSKLSKIDIEEILSIDYPYSSFEEDLDLEETLILLFIDIYNQSNSTIGRLLDLDDSKVSSIRRKAKKTLYENYQDEWKNQFVTKFNSLQIISISFDKLTNDLEFVDREIQKENKIQGSLKSLILFFIVIAMILVITSILFKSGACSQNSVDSSETISVIGGLLW